VTGLRVCLAEDNQDQMWALKSLLTALGHEVVCEAPDGRALVEGVLSAPADLIITDFDMPNLDGLEAAEEIATKRRLPIILLSGHADAKRVMIDHEPIMVVVPKPISRDTLVDAIERAMAKGA
jgi:CheY-like chemotaxis protein